MNNPKAVTPISQKNCWFEGPGFEKTTSVVSGRQLAIEALVFKYKHFPRQAEKVFILENRKAFSVMTNPVAVLDWLNQNSDRQLHASSGFILNGPNLTLADISTAQYAIDSDTVKFAYVITAIQVNSADSTLNHYNSVVFDARFAEMRIRTLNQEVLKFKPPHDGPRFVHVSTKITIEYNY